VLSSARFSYSSRRNAIKGLRPAILIILSTIAIGAVAACGSDDDDGNGGGDGGETSLQDYLTAFETNGNSAQTSVLNLSDDLSEEDSFTALAAIFDDTVIVVSLLDAPDEVQSDHDDFVAATTDLASAFSDLAEDPSDAAAADRADDATARFETACTNIAAIGADNGISIDVDCIFGD